MLGYNSYLVALVSGAIRGVLRGYCGGTAGVLENMDPRPSNVGGKPLEDIKVLPVIAGGINRGFQNERLRSQFGMGKNAPEGVFAYVPLADIGMTIDVRSKRPLAIVGVDYAHVPHPKALFRMVDRSAQAGRSADVEARG